MSDFNHKTKSQKGARLAVIDDINGHMMGFFYIKDNWFELVGDRKSLIEF